MLKRPIVALLLVVACAFVIARPAVHAQASGTDRYLVVFKAEKLPSDVARRVAASGGTLLRAFDEIGVVSVIGDDSFAARMAKDAQVLSVGGEHVFGLPQSTAIEMQPDVAGQDGAPTPADSYYKTYQWDMRRIGAPDVWARLPVAATTARVAVLDVGVMDTHPDLVGQVDNSISTAYCSTSGGTNNTAGYPIYTTFIDFDAHPVWSPADGCAALGFTDYEFHGTHVAGTVAAKFGGGRVVGVAPDARVGAYKVFDIYGYKGKLYVGAFDGPIFDAIIDATLRGYGVISMSLGGTAYRNSKGDNASWLAWDRVAKWANRQGVVIVAAAGNAALDLNGYTANIPSDLSTVVCVSASAASLLAPDANGNLSPAGPDLLASYSNYGAAVNITAPGGDCPPEGACDSHYWILSDGINASGNATYYLATGTSMATPHVSAVAAYVRAIHPDWTPGDIRAWLQSTAEAIGNRQGFGHGMLNANAAAR